MKRTGLKTALGIPRATCLPAVGVLGASGLGCATPEGYRVSKRLMQEENYDQAVIELRKLVAKDPANSQYQIRLAEAESQAADRHVSRAKECRAGHRPRDAQEELRIALAAHEINQLQRQAQEIAQLGKSRKQMQTSYQPTRVPQSPGAETISPQGEGSPTEVYLQAFGDYASGRYQIATHGFETFLQRFPNNSYASNAQFWLSDCHFNQQQYALAIQEVLS